MFNCQIFLHWNLNQISLQEKKRKEKFLIIHCNICVYNPHVTFFFLHWWKRMLIRFYSYVNASLVRSNDKKNKTKTKTTPHAHANTLAVIWLVGWILWYINLCRLFNAKSSLYIYIKYTWFGLVGFDTISTIVGYLMLNPLYTNILDM